MEETLIINELIAKTADIDLADLPMSIRLYNCLRRGGYATLTDVMIEAPDKFSQIRNFGKTSEQELMTIIQFARTASREQILDYCQKKVWVESQKLTLRRSRWGLMSLLTILAVLQSVNMCWEKE